MAILLVFKPEVDKDRIMAWIKKLDEKGVLELTRGQEFDKEIEFPVLYFP